MKKTKIASIFMSAAVALSMTLGSFGDPENGTFEIYTEAAVSFKNPTDAGMIGYMRMKPYVYSEPIYYSDGALEYKAVDIDNNGDYDCIEIVKGSDELTEIDIPQKLPLSPPPKEPDRAEIEQRDPELSEEEIDNLYEAEYEKYKSDLDTYNNDYQTALADKKETKDFPFVRLISANAFSECGSLSDVTIPPSVYWIGADAFEETPWLESEREKAVSAPANQRQKGMVIVNDILLDGKRCEGIMSDPSASGTDLAIPKTVKSIADKAFYGNDSIETNGDYNDDGEYFIGYYTYKTVIKREDGEEYEEEVPVAHSLPAFVIPSNVLSVGNEAFSGCTSISNVKFTSGIKSIGSMAFAECSSIEEVAASAVSKDFSCLGYQAFQGTPWLDRKIEDASEIGYMAFGGSAALLDGSGASGDVIIPSGLTGFPTINVISPYSFMGNSGIDTVKIHNNISIIGEHAFEDCSSLTEFGFIKGSSQGLSVGAAAFKNCSSLESTAVPSSGTEIPDELFSGCSSLASFNIPGTVTRIGNEAFFDCDSLKELNIDNLKNLESVGIRAFDGTAWLEDKRQENADNNYLVTAKLKNGALLIDGKAACDTVIIPSDITEILGYSFQENISITDVTIGENVKKIGEGAFEGCASLEKVKICSTDASIGANAFNDFSGTIYCIKDSSALEYAKEHDIAYELMTVPAVTTPAETTATTTETTVTTEETTTTAKTTTTTTKATTTTAKTTTTKAKTTTAKTTTTKAKTTTAKTTTTKAKTTTAKTTTTKAKTTTAKTTTTKAKTTTAKTTTTKAKATTAKTTTTKAKATTAKTTTTKAKNTTAKTTTTKAKTTTAKTTTTKARTTTAKTTAVTPVTTTTQSTGPRPDRIQNVGDCNGDGKINVRDAAYLAKMIASNRVKELSMLCDFNGDGSVNVRDAAAIAKYLAVIARNNPV